MDKDVLQVFNKYRGYIGFAALTLALATLVRIAISLAMFVSNRLSYWIKGRSGRERLRKQHCATLLRIPYLEIEQRKFLKSLIDANQQHFALPDDGTDHSWVGGYADVLMAEIGIPYTKYKIKPWVWKYLKTHSSVLEVGD